MNASCNRLTTGAGVPRESPNDAPEAGHKRYRPRLADNLVHVNHFSPGSLRRALERAGFTDVAIAIGPPEIPPASGAMGALANLVRRSIYYAGRLVPGCLDTPLALNLLAYARRSS